MHRLSQNKSQLWKKPKRRIFGREAISQEREYLDSQLTHGVKQEDVHKRS